MDGESPFDLEMDDEDDTMVSTLILAGANMNQAKTYAAAVRGKTDAPTYGIVWSWRDHKRGKSGSKMFECEGYPCVRPQDL